MTGILRVPRPAALAAIAALAIGLAAAGGYGAHGTTVIHTVTVQTRTVPGPVRTLPARTVVRTVTRTVPGPAGIPCAEGNGRVWIAGGGGYGIQSTTCTVTPVMPYASGIIALTAADGTTDDYQLTPAG